VTFPESYGARHLAGKAAVFACTVKAVKGPKPAGIDDELAKRYGADSLEALKEQIAGRLEAEYLGAARAVMKRALLDQLDALVKFDLPASLVTAEANQIAHQLWHEEHPEVHGHDHGTVEPTDEHRSLAERRVRLGLLLAEMGRKAEITVTDAEMTKAVLAQARQYPGQERAFFEFVQKNPQMQQQLRAPIFEDKVVDHIVATASVTENTTSTVYYAAATPDLAGAITYALSGADEALFNINANTGVATFASGSGTTMTDALADLAARMTAASDAAGEMAFFQVNKKGHMMLFISDGVAGVTANDVVVQLMGISSIHQIDLTGGNLTIMS
jgi:hypothetical protein